MNGYGTLPATGSAALIVGGYAIGQWTLLAVAVTLVLVGAVALRLGYRRGRAVADR